MLTPSQRELLVSIPDRFPLARIDRVWIFSPHSGKTRETGLFVVSLLPEDAETGKQRTLFTLRYQADVVKGNLQRTDAVSEEGRAPPERIERVIEGVIARSAEEATDPVVAEIDGQEDNWAALLDRLGQPA
ncbi:MAG: hypothetical protein WD737_13415 [Gemmatimonadota bacterium]